MTTEPNSEPQRRQRRRSLTDLQILSLPRKKSRYPYPVPQSRGLYVRVMPGGPPHVFACQARNPVSKRQVWSTIGPSDRWKIAEACEEAQRRIRRVEMGQEPVEPLPVAPESVADVMANWLTRHVAKQRFRTEQKIIRNINKHILPVLGTRAFTSLKRSDIALLADRIEDTSGARTADVVVSILRSTAFWYATRAGDDYIPPFIKGMKRDTAKPRSRILDDDEIRAIWKATSSERDVTFGALIRLSLLCGQRKSITAAMRWQSISDGVWSIPQEDGAKGNIGRVRLPRMALDIIAKLPRIAGNPYVLAGPGTGPLANYTHAKERLDERSGVHGWVLHDARRTHRSLASRSGANRDHSERVLGHKPVGVESTYDRHDYTEEKSIVLAMVADQISEIIGTAPSGDKIVQMKGRHARRR
jgi:integrase